MNSLKMPAKHTKKKRRMIRLQMNKTKINYYFKNIKFLNMYNN